MWLSTLLTRGLGLFAWRSSGRPKVVGEAPRGLKGNLTAHIEPSPDGRFLYASNRGHDSIVCFAVDGESGGLTYVAHTESGGQSPRAFGCAPSCPPPTDLICLRARSVSVYVSR